MREWLRKHSLSDFFFHLTGIHLFFQNVNYDALSVWMAASMRCAHISRDRACVRAWARHNMKRVEIKNPLKSARRFRAVSRSIESYFCQKASFAFNSILIPFFIFASIHVMSWLFYDCELVMRAACERREGTRGRTWHKNRERQWKAFRN